MSQATKGSIDIELPDHNTLNTVLPGDTLTGAVRCPSYTLGDGEHALRHASSLLNILLRASVSDETPKQSIPPSTERITWLVDCIEALNEEQRRWKDRGNYNPASLLNQALSLVFPHSGVERAVIHKLYSVIVLLAADVAASQTGTTQPERSDPPATKVLSLALVQISGTAIKQRPLAKLAAAQLLKPLEQMLVEGVASDLSGDLQVRPLCPCSVQPRPDICYIQKSVDLFREAIVFPTSQSFSSRLSPRSFVDRDLRSKLQSFEFKAHATTDQKRLVKRRKLTQEPPSMQLVLKQLSRVLGLPEVTNLNQLESGIL